MAELAPNQLVLNDVRLARVSLTRPYTGPGTAVDPTTGALKGKYHVDAIISPDHPQLEAIKNRMREAVAYKFKDQAAVVLEQIRANNKFPLHRGDVDRAGRPEYAGKLYLSASNEEQPTIVVSENGVNIATRGTPTILTPAHPCYPYPGCYANVILSFFAYSHPTGGRGVSASIMGVQFLRHGDRLVGASVAAATEFPVLKAADVDATPGAAAPSASAGLL